MLVRFNENNETMSTALYLYQPGPVSGPYTNYVISNDGFGGTLTSGNLAGTLAGTGGAFLTWKDKEETIASWLLDDETARDNAIDALGVAAEADSQSVVLYKDGTVSVSS